MKTIIMNLLKTAKQSFDVVVVVYVILKLNNLIAEWWQVTISAAIALILEIIITILED